MEGEKIILETALDRLGEQFARRDWKYLDVPPGSPREKTYEWPGGPDEEIMICVHKGPQIHEDFHRQDFFFFNFAYRGDYGALSHTSDNRITVRENECYIGQPFAGYALDSRGEDEIVIIGVLIRKDTFFRVFFPALSADAKLFRFFLDAMNNEYSEESIHICFDDACNVRTLLEMMAIEYADPQEDTQEILRPIVLTLLMQVARQYRRAAKAPDGETLSDKIVRYMGEHADAVSLKEIAKHFSYHPNYISGLLRRELGRTFSELLLEQRMSRAEILLKCTELSVEDIAQMLGYTNNSNFYKAFRDYFGRSPREYARGESEARRTAT